MRYTFVGMKKSFRLGSELASIAFFPPYQIFLAGKPFPGFSLQKPGSIGGAI
jgi:hypothetical protein